MIPPASLAVDVSHQIHAGLSLQVFLALGTEIGVLFGDSGAGKSTLLRLIAGFEAPDRGRIVLDSNVLLDTETRQSIPLRRRRIGMIFQDDLLFPHLNVAANIGFGLKGQRRPVVRARVAEVARICGVERLLDRSPATLSGGERQRVGLARALAPRPRLLLCDEPVSALDLASRNTLIEHLRAVQRAEGVPMIYVTHSPSEAIALGHRLFLLSRGRIVASGTPLQVLADAWSHSAHGIEGLRNIFPATVESHLDSGTATRLQLTDGPLLVIPHLDRPPGTAVDVEVWAEEILLALGPVQAVSARNLISGTVERIVPHGAQAEVVVRTGGICWLASVVAPAVASLGLGPGSHVNLVIKARSCRALDSSLR